MSCNKAIARGSFDSPTVAAVAEGGTLQTANFTSNSNCIEVNGGEVTVRKGGNYIVHVNATLVATEAGPQEIQLFRNGSAVPGAHGIETAAAVGDSVSIAFATPVTVECCGSTTLSVRALTATSQRVYAINVEEVD